MFFPKNFYLKKKVFVTGGAGFIGRHLVNALIKRGAFVTVGDNLSAGSLSALLQVFSAAGLSYKKTPAGYKIAGGHRFTRVNFEEYEETRRVFAGHEMVFHLAARIGGRGFITDHPADCCENFSINQNVIKAAYTVGVDRVQFASSACVYPVSLQQRYGSRYLIKETDAFLRHAAQADQEYGWAKLMGEMTLRAYHRQYGLNGSITRYVTVYGPGENDTHAIIALIGRALQKQDPYIVWGSGKQDRDFTYVDDIVEGTLLAGQKITDADAVNLGTSRRHTIREVMECIFDLLGWRPAQIVFDTSRPEGVATRALDISKAKQRLNFALRYSLRQGLLKTIEWLKQKHG